MSFKNNKGWHEFSDMQQIGGVNIDKMKKLFVHIACFYDQMKILASSQNWKWNIMDSYKIPIKNGQ